MTKQKAPVARGRAGRDPGELVHPALRNSVLFPGSIIPSTWDGRSRFASSRRRSARSGRSSASSPSATRGPRPGRRRPLHRRLRRPHLKVIKLAKDNFSVILQGVSRVRILEYSQRDPFIVSRVQAMPDLAKPDVELDALVLNLKDIAKRVVKLMPSCPRKRRRCSTASPSRASSPTSSPPTWTSPSRRSRRSWRPSISRPACARCWPSSRASSRC